MKDWLATLASGKPGFQRRREQDRAIYAIARALEPDGEDAVRVIALEGPTGIGKSIAYLVAGLVAAAAHQLPHGDSQSRRDSRPHDDRQRMDWGDSAMVKRTVHGVPRIGVALFEVCALVRTGAQQRSRPCRTNLRPGRRTWSHPLD